jgi:hypothetical protein
MNMTLDSPDRRSSPGPPLFVRDFISVPARERHCLERHREVPARELRAVPRARSSQLRWLSCAGHARAGADAPRPFLSTRPSISEHAAGGRSQAGRRERLLSAPATPRS